ncbi:MAG: trypsin-like peptidase domain-containing protein [Mycolicibacterium cosmeticum]|nr:trypsin-like peptidase domain-containing protein [Mycolicibacterium cosmeticum]
MTESDADFLSSSRLRDQVPGSLGWQLIVAGFAHRFFDPFGPQRAKFAKSVGEPLTDTPFEGWAAGVFLRLLQQMGIQPGSATSVTRLLAAMERAGLLLSAGWDARFPVLGQRYVSQGVLSHQRQGYLWLAEAIGPELIINAFRSVTVQISATESPHWGSGLVLDEAHIITNKHVAEELMGKGLQIVMPMFGAEREPVLGQSLEVFLHPEVDVAVIQVRPSVEGNLQALKGMVFRDPAWADEVYVLGYPRVAWTVDSGITLQRGEVVLPMAEVPRRRDEKMEPWDTPGRTNVFLYSAIARPGNSGGPIVAHDGRVIGIVVEDSAHTPSSNPEADGGGESVVGSVLSEAAPFYQGIPASELMRALEFFGLQHLITIEDPLNL